MKRMLKDLTLAAVAIGLSAWVTPSLADKASISLPPESAQFKPAAGSDVAATYCTICHSADYIYTAWAGARLDCQLHVNLHRIDALQKDIRPI